MAAIGVDGCKGGWAFFRLGEGEPEFGVVGTLGEVVVRARDGDRVLVDVPIGLRDEGSLERSCDAEARAILGPARRSSSVFSPPCRAAVYASSWEEAQEVNRRRTGRGVSVQSWAITPRIREADELLRSSPRARACMREAHPEILFWGLAGRRPMSASKKRREGFLERFGVIRAALDGAEDLAGPAYMRHGGFRVDRHDVLDALVAAVVAGRADADLLTLPASPERDGEGLPMEMVYALEPSTLRPGTVTA